MEGSIKDFLDLEFDSHFSNHRQDRRKGFRFKEMEEWDESNKKKNKKKIENPCNFSPNDFMKAAKDIKDARIGFIYKGFLNLEWKKRTYGAFPAPSKFGDYLSNTSPEIPLPTHHAYVWEKDRLVTKVCPCTSQGMNREGIPYIPQGADLLFQRNRMNKRTYVLVIYTISLSREDALDFDIELLGFYSREQLKYDE